jgi:hypothetical protein
VYLVELDDGQLVARTAEELSHAPAPPASKVEP